MTDSSDENAQYPDRARRDSLLLLTELHEEGGRPIAQVRVRNLSATGLMVECGPPLTRGDRVTFTLRGVGVVAATISWWRDGRAGVAFDTPIDPMAVRRPGGEGAGTGVMIAEPYKVPRYYSVHDVVKKVPPRKR